MTSFGLWIGGRERTAATGEVFERINPFDGSVAATFANADASDAAAAIASARSAFDDGPWTKSTARDRYNILVRAADGLARMEAEFADRMVRESGKPVTLSRGEIQFSIKTLQYYAGLALSMEGSAINERNHDALGLILHEPVGVAGLITAWNFPLVGIVCKLAPAIAAGCTVVAKPSHLCSGPGVMLAKLMTEVGLPDGVFNLITSDIDRGAIVGQELAGSSLIDKIAFTGSTAAGRAVMQAASSNNKRLALELGGKSANIVFEDAPFDEAVATAIGAITFNSGQQCSAGSRLLLQRSIYDRFIEGIVGVARGLKIGDPADPTTNMGPLISPEQQDRVLNYIRIGLEDGQLATGGAVPSDEALSKGNFVEPTVIHGLKNSDRLAQEEVFGPVLAVIPFDTEEEAIEMANDSAYGLAGGVWTASLSRALRVTKAIRTGKMFVNCYNTGGIDDMPHGGYKGSGVGREFGLSGLEEFQQIKTVQIKLV